MRITNKQVKELGSGWRKSNGVVERLRTEQVGGYADIAL